MIPERTAKRPVVERAVIERAVIERPVIERPVIERRAIEPRGSERSLIAGPRARSVAVFRARVLAILSRVVQPSQPRASKACSATGSR